MLYGSLKRVTPPTASLMGVSEFADWVRADTSDVAALQLALDAAVDMIDGTGLLGAAILPQQWQQTIESPPAGGEVMIRVGPLQSIDSATITQQDDTTASIDPALFERRLVEGRDVVIIPSEASGAKRLDLVYTSHLFASAADVPQPIKAAVCLLGASLYDNRGSMPMRDDETLYRVGRLIERWRLRYA